MIFRTTIEPKEIQKPSEYIDYQSKTGLIGSCFVENIHKKLSYYKFQNWVNPYGILFNPKAIEKALSDIAQQKVYAEKDLVYENEKWHSLHHHSDFSNVEASTILDKINSSIKKTATNLKETNHLILTLGTAWVYHHIETDQLVANCHKIPQRHFVKRILSSNEIVESLQNSIRLIQKINPEINLILTLSPVRHLNNGMTNNSQSKAHLLTAIHKVVADDNASYFPSYEIVMDDLRDYRFYSSDMLHPNQSAIDYIWSIFREVWIAPKAYPVMNQVAQVQKGLLHKAFTPDSNQHKQFLEKLAKQQEILFNDYKIAF